MSTETLEVIAEAGEPNFVQTSENVLAGIKAEIDALVSGYYFGCCPECGQGEHVNIFKTNMVACHKHRVVWFVGINLFSNWQHESEADWQHNAALLATYREIKESEAVYPETAAKIARLGGEYKRRLLEFTRNEIADSLARLRPAFQRFTSEYAEGNYGAFRLASAVMWNALHGIEHVDVILAGPVDLTHDPFPGAFPLAEPSSDGLPF